MLNETPNNNDVKRVEYNVFNEAPNSNDATRVGINVSLTAVGATVLNGDYIAIMLWWPRRVTRSRVRNAAR